MSNKWGTKVDERPDNEDPLKKYDSVKEVVEDPEIEDEDRREQLRLLALRRSDISVR